MLFHEPLRIAFCFELLKRILQFSNCGKLLNPEHLFLECLDEPFLTSISLWFPNKRGTRYNAKEVQLLLEVVARIWASVVMTERQSFCTIL